MDRCNDERGNPDTHNVTLSEGDPISISVLADLATIVVGGVGVPVALYQLSLARRARQHELANIYIHRFWDIDDQRRRAVHDGDDDEALLQDERYIRLCEDEFEIARLQFLDSKTWAVWHAAIRDALHGSRSLAEAGADELGWRAVVETPFSTSRLHAPGSLVGQS